jgi:hypothetical protein
VERSRDDGKERKKREISTAEWRLAPQKAENLFLRAGKSAGGTDCLAKKQSVTGFLAKVMLLWASVVRIYSANDHGMEITQRMNLN